MSPHPHPPCPQVSPGTALFLYTKDALSDVRAGLIRPSIHCLSSEFNMSWEIEDDGMPYAAPQQVGGRKQGGSVTVGTLLVNSIVRPFTILSGYPLSPAGLPLPCALPEGPRP